MKTNNYVILTQFLELGNMFVIILLALTIIISYYTLKIFLKVKRHNRENCTIRDEQKISPLNTSREIEIALNKVIVSIESERILAEREGNFSKEIELNNKRIEIEEIRDEIREGNMDEELLEKARRIVIENPTYI